MNASFFFLSFPSSCEFFQILGIIRHKSRCGHFFWFFNANLYTVNNKSGCKRSSTKSVRYDLKSKRMIYIQMYSQFLMVIYVIDHYWRLSFLNKLWRREYQMFCFFLFGSTRIRLLCPVLNSIWAQQAILAFRYFFYERSAAILCELYRLSVYTYRAVWWELV